MDRRALPDAAKADAVSRVVLCSHSAVDMPPRKDGYAAFREAVLKAGRFSVWEATESKANAKLFERLCRDPEIVTEPLGFPWTKVVRRENNSPSGA